MGLMKVIGFREGGPHRGRGRGATYSLGREGEDKQANRNKGLSYNGIVMHADYFYS